MRIYQCQFHGNRSEPIETDTETVTVQREEPREEPNAATSFAGETPQNMQTNIPYMNQNNKCN